VNITADTNVLLRLIVDDDAAQGSAALEALEAAGLVAISVHALCELAWVLRGRYEMSRAEVGAAIRGLTRASNVVANHDAIAAGLASLDAGGDFADGVIAFDGRQLGGETFVTFDRAAVRLLSGQGHAAVILT
jgi:predicted nucleic-acid-binding protein